MFWIIVGLAALSLLLSEWGWRNMATANFYLAPTRAWELFAGSIAAFVVQRRGVRRNDALSLIGLAAILFSIFAYDETVPFPSLYALVPVLGVVLIILFADHATWAARVLSLRGVVGIGLVSYSAYLWHQPLLAFARINGSLTASLALILALLSFVLAWLSWRFVESPFRNRRFLSRNAVFALSLLGLGAFVLFGAAGHKTDGFAFRLTDAQRAFLDRFDNDIPEWRYFERAGLYEKFWLACDFYDLDAFRAGFETDVPTGIDPACTAPADEQPVLFIWGDSHAQHYSHGVREMLSDRYALRQVASSGCSPALAAGDSATDYCQRSNHVALSSIATLRPEVVLLAQGRGHDAAKLDTLVDTLNDLGVGTVLLMGPTPQWTIDLPKILVRSLDDIPRRTTAFLNHATRERNAELKAHFADRPGVIYVDVIGEMCDAAGCLVYLGEDVVEGITSWDYGHLTPIASERVGRALRALLAE